MCGIVGVITADTDHDACPALQRMLRSQAHRGPDDEGAWSGAVAGTRVDLGVSRLAILDLSPAGHQPMVSACGRYVLAFNGEVYNYLELRHELRGLGCEFRSNSDTEVVFQALRIWGPAALGRFNGMWGLAFLDRERASLLLARDRFGVKPLYIYAAERRLYFASEIKSILEGSDERFAINAAVAAHFLDQLRLEADDQTFFSGVEKLPAGHYIEVVLKPCGFRSGAPRPFWQLEPVDCAAESPEQQIQQVRRLFTDAVRLRLRSDVPVGVLLSGGVDSSSVAATVLQINGPACNLHLFSAVSDEPGYSEEPFVDLMATHLGQRVEKVQLNQTPGEALTLFEEAIWFNDEPLGSFASVAQFLLMQRAKELGVTVILSGQGADELLVGYQSAAVRYVEGLIREHKLGGAVRTIAGFLRRGTVLNEFGPADIRRFLLRRLPRTGIDVRGPLLRGAIPDLPLRLGSSSLREQEWNAMYRHSIPAIVHSEDRMSMAWSREIRNPFLDYRLVTLLHSLPGEAKVRDGWTKWVFRQAMAPLLPPEIAWRKDKQGFINPERKWLQHDLRPRIEAMLREPMVTARAGIVDQAALRRRYAAYYAKQDRFRLASWREALHPVTLELWARRFERYLRW